MRSIRRRRPPGADLRGRGICCGALVALALIGADRAVGAQAPVELNVDTLRVEGRARTVRVYAPPSARPGAPLVLALHSSPATGAVLREFLAGRLEELADRDGFVVAYPDGWEGYWNDCRAAAAYAANRLDVDDPAFLRAVVARLHESHGIDPLLVRVLGFSNGAQMAFRLALEAPGDVQAIAAVAATLPAQENLDCVSAGEPLPVLVVVGTADPISPYEGGEVRAPDGRSRGRVRSALETAAWFARLAAAGTEPRRETVLGPDPVSGTWVERLTWERGPAEPQVVLLTVHGGGHVIPGRDVAFPEEAGPVERRFDAIEEAVRFFERQPPTRGGAGPPGPKAGGGLAGVKVVTALTAADAGDDPVTAGSWRLSFGHDGRFSASQDGAAAVEGHYDVSGDRLTLHDEVGTMACEGRPGVYRWSFSGDLLKMERVEDVCPGRAAVLTTRPLRRECP